MASCQCLVVASLVVACLAFVVVVVVGALFDLLITNVASGNCGKEEQIVNDGRTFIEIDIEIGNGLDKYRHTHTHTRARRVMSEIM